jgi:hypothetical protein
VPLQRQSATPFGMARLAGAIGFLQQEFGKLQMGERNLWTEANLPGRL